MSNISCYVFCSPLKSYFQLPDTFQDRYTELVGQPASSGTITHLKRDIFHKIWELLLDPELLDAYEHGIVLKCADGVVRRIFPRFFTYSADYPEKYVLPVFVSFLFFLITNVHLYRVILATIRYLASCPCPCCFIKKEHISGLGTKADNQRRGHLRTDTEQRQSKVNQSRTWIFENGRGVNSTWVNDLLQEDSWIPTRVGIHLNLLFPC